MLRYFINFITNITKTPFIIAIIKESIMGNKINKTLDYYRNKKITSIFIEDLQIDYSSFGKNFTIYCDNSSYTKALEYIKMRPNPFYKKKILLACEMHSNGKFVDITERVLQMGGPDCDFYQGCGFKELVCKDISDYPVYMITDELLAYKFELDDKIEFIWTPMIDIKKKLT